LDFYPAITENGQSTRRQFLQMYLTNEFNPNNLTDRQIRNLPFPLQVSIEAEVEENRKILETAEQIRMIRYGELNNAKHFNEIAIRQERLLQQQEQEQVRIEALKSFDEKRLDIDFIKYFQSLAYKREGTNTDNWISCLHYLKAFTGGKLTIRDVTESFCNNFKEYLLTAPSRKSTVSVNRLSQNSAVSYFNKLKASLKQAYKDGYLIEPLNIKVDGIPIAETSKSFLSMDELNRLANTPCINEILKKISLFSALTGLRFSDCINLTWSNVFIDTKEGAYLTFKQQKTNNVEDRHPISDQSLNLLGIRKEPESKIFEGLKYHEVVYLLPKWLLDAGITKKFTFHGFRHTYATLSLSNGTDIYTVSKMLGHRDLKTTAVYAKIVDETKRRASNTIQLDLK
jgi:integrase